MYRVLIVEDEPWTLLGLVKTFDWEEKGYQVVGQTTNPVEAFDFICLEKPDVVFTDVRMPEISGIELVKRTRELGMDTEFIIISGFAEFSYAQKALSYGVFEYLLKPVDVNKGNAVLDKLFVHLQAKDGETDKEKRIAADHTDYEGQNNSDMNGLMEYIDKNYKKDLSLRDLADRFYMNYSYCSELFKKIKGVNFTEYITYKRMKEAVRLLLDSNRTVNQIAQEVGYRDYYYFNKRFKAIYHQTPFQYRRNSRKV